MAAKKTATKKASTTKKAKASPATKSRVANSKPEAKEKKMSALDAAAKVLGETGEAMTTKELIDAMAATRYWTSPGGKTPERTLYSALARDVEARGKESRFKKAERGKFIVNA